MFNSGHPFLLLSLVYRWFILFHVENIFHMIHFSSKYYNLARDFLLSLSIFSTTHNINML